MAVGVTSAFFFKIFPWESVIMGTPMTHNNDDARSFPLAATVISDPLDILLPSIINLTLCTEYTENEVTDR